MLSPPSTPPPRRRVTTCPQPDCNVTFHDKDLVYLHLARVHPGAETSEPAVNTALSASLTKFVEDKNQHFRKPPRKMEPDETALLVCHDTLCKQTFTCENLRDFHYNRMHHSRHHSMLSQLTETEKNEEQRKKGYDCVETDCDARFLCAELRDFHYARAHPLLWKATQERQSDTTISDREKRNKNEEETPREDLKCDSSTNTPLVEIYDRSLTQSQSSKSSICESEGSTSDEDFDLHAIGVKESEEKVTVVEGIDILTVKLEMVDTSSGDVTTADGKVKTLTFSESSLICRLPMFQYRSKSEMMMNRNALANPGASKWVVRP